MLLRDGRNNDIDFKKKEEEIIAQFRVCTVLPLRHFGVYIKREIHRNRGIHFSENGYIYSSI